MSEEENRHAGKPGEPGERGTGQRGGAGGAGGEGGEGGFEGGVGGVGGTGGQMGPTGPRGERGPANRRALVGYLLLTAGVIIALLFSYLNDRQSEDARDTLCRNQAAVVEMQRLFLAEHANVRAQLEDAGIPDEHADPDLLDRLAALIEAADCNVADLESKP